MNNAYNAGVDVSGLKELILSVYESADIISKKLEYIGCKVSETVTFYQSDDGDLYRKKFKEMQLQFDTLVKNIRIYGDDLANVRYKYEKNNLINVDIFKSKEYDKIK